MSRKGRVTYLLKCMEVCQVAMWCNATPHGFGGRLSLQQSKVQISVEFSLLFFSFSFFSVSLLSFSS